MKDDKFSDKPITALGPPDEFAGGDVVAAVRCPVMRWSTRRWLHAIVVRHRGERQTFSAHLVWNEGAGWTEDQGHDDLGYAEAVHLMAELAAGKPEPPVTADDLERAIRCLEQARARLPYNYEVVLDELEGRLETLRKHAGEHAAS